jgi:hypothetical protein
MSFVTVFVKWQKVLGSTCSILQVLSFIILLTKKTSIDLHIIKKVSVTFPIFGTFEDFRRPSVSSDRRLSLISSIPKFILPYIFGVTNDGKNDEK